MEKFIKNYKFGGKKSFDLRVRSRHRDTEGLMQKSLNLDTFQRKEPRTIQEIEKS
jgi:hypothetical protein